MIIWVVTLVMSFGRTTFGSLYDILPGSSDIFIRRFQMGVQLSGILLAGIGLVFLGQLVLRGVLRLFPEERRGLGHPAGRARHRRRAVHRGAGPRALPGLERPGHLRRHNATNIGLQAEADAQQGPQIDRLLDYVRAHPKGRVYAGSPTNWGNDFLVGAVPVFKYLESKDIDEVGYTLRTASLMTDPEYFFDETNPGDYPLFGIGYLIMPAGMAPPVQADKVGCSGDYCLWALPHSGYIHVYDTTGVLTATRADVGTQSTTLLESPLLNEQRDLTVGFNGQAASTPTAADASAWRDRRARRRGARRPPERRRPRCRAHDAPGHRRPQRLLRPGLARHRERPAGPHGHGGAGAGRRGGRPGRAHGRVHLRRLRVLHPLFVLALLVLVVLAFAPLVSAACPRAQGCSWRYGQWLKAPG